MEGLSSIAQYGISAFLGACLLLPLIMLRYRDALKNASLKLYPVRALLSIVAMVSWIEALKTFGVTESMLVEYLVPIIAVIFASFAKEEKLRWACVFAGITCYGVISVTLKSAIAVTNHGFMAALLATFCWAGYNLICKKQSYKEHFVVQIFCAFVCAACFLSPFAITTIGHLNGKALLMLTGLAILRIFNVLFLFLAIKLAGLNWIVPVAYVNLPIMACMQWIFFQKSTPTTYWIAGAILTSINIIMMMMRRIECKKTILPPTISIDV